MRKNNVRSGCVPETPEIPKTPDPKDTVISKDPKGCYNTILTNLAITILFDAEKIAELRAIIDPIK
jgi:hypothetical protein